MPSQDQTRVCLQPKHPLPNGYAPRPRGRKVTGALRAQASALLAFRVVAPGGGSPPPRRAAIEHRVGEAVARVRVVMCELRAEELERHLHAALLEADAGGPDEAA